MIRRETEKELSPLLERYGGKRRTRKTRRKRTQKSKKSRKHLRR
jgi:hypothetical protein